MSEWDQAACNGQETRIFFDHEDLRGEKRAVSLAKARAVCAPCAIRGTCLNYALESGQQFGLWGGLTAAERSEILVAGQRRESLHPHRAAS
jgi:WhiB family transcriptional regulator, redox-sensing transcriptional regulator